MTPCVVQAKRNADITVTINKDGYQPQTIPLTKEIPGSGAAGFAGNLVLGGLVGMGVDAVTGAAQDHKPNPVIVTLRPLRPSRGKAATGKATAASAAELSATRELTPWSSHGGGPEHDHRDHNEGSHNRGGDQGFLLRQQPSGRAEAHAVSPAL